ncbi:ribosome maturation factor RimM [Aliidiomarina maris]|uniref:Ribosome maturation factor RimM n=1 Tax=Aliidiomarina maris TaxID=531312 RepID=A0A327X782_9GAMM|nr:ribosome maturation factor RimM [Aliidiomarina maris]MBA3989112.1 ribosome maturation factor RimM [Idiomarina sp.]RAK01743.1 16S rRNA processing protein RimM [Aliidiomarina maris]RUO28560.1 ribosome maturation factor RimM [Aliidiomarina maris]
MSDNNPVILGTIGAVYGIKGWLKINSFTDQPEGIFEYQPWLVGQEGNWQPMEVAQWRWHNKGLIAKFANMDDRDAAQLLVGRKLAIAADQLPQLPDDEFYWRDLIGLQVVNTENYDMGTVSQMLPTVSNDVLVVTANSNDAFGKRERLIPFIQSQYVVAVDRDAKRITVDWPADF